MSDTKPDLNSALEGARQWVLMLKRAEKLEEAVVALAGYEQVIRERQTALDTLDKEIAKRKADGDDQQKRSDQAKQAADEIVKACKELAEKAKADKAEAEKDLAQRMYEIQMEQGRRQAKLDEDMKKYMAEMGAAKAATRKVYDEERAKLMAELALKAERVKGLQAEYDALKAKFA